MKRILVTPEIVLDIAVAREPHVRDSRSALALIEVRGWHACIGAESAVDLFRAMKKLGGERKAAAFLRVFLEETEILTLSGSTILSALQDEEAEMGISLVLSCAVEHQCQTVLSRQLRSMRGLEVLSPGEFLSKYSD